MLRPSVASKLGRRFAGVHFKSTASDVSVNMPPQVASSANFTVAYSPSQWRWVLNPAATCAHLTHEEQVGYFSHMRHTLRLSAMTAVAGTAGFSHAFFPSTFPFLAEEVGVELATVLKAKRDSVQQAEMEYSPDPDMRKHRLQLRGWRCLETQNVGKFYAFSPGRWVWTIDGRKHVVFSGGSYWNHGYFACWASLQFYIAALTGVVHAVLPSLFPYVAEDIVMQLGTLIQNRRKLRNIQKDNTFANPTKLTEYFSAEYQTKFAKAHAEARKREHVRTDIHDAGEKGTSESEMTLLEQKAIKNKLEPGREVRLM